MCSYTPPSVMVNLFLPANKKLVNELILPLIVPEQG